MTACFISLHDHAGSGSVRCRGSDIPSDTPPLENHYRLLHARLRRLLSSLKSVQRYHSSNEREGGREKSNLSLAIKEPVLPARRNRSTTSPVPSLSCIQSFCTGSPCDTQFS